MATVPAVGRQRIGDNKMSRTSYLPSPKCHFVLYCFAARSRAFLACA